MKKLNTCCGGRELRASPSFGGSKREALMEHPEHKSHRHYVTAIRNYRPRICRRKFLIRAPNRQLSRGEPWNRSRDGVPAQSAAGSSIVTGTALINYYRNVGRKFGE